METIPDFVSLARNNPSFLMLFIYVFIIASFVININWHWKFQNFSWKLSIVKNIVSFQVYLSLSLTWEYISSFCSCTVLLGIGFVEDKRRKKEHRWQPRLFMSSQVGRNMVFLCRWFTFRAYFTDFSIHKFPISH